MSTVIVDTGVWYAMFDSNDQRNNEIDEKVELIEKLSVVVPWPTVFETLRTRFVRNSIALASFEHYMKSPNIEFIEDEAYRELALDLSFESSLRRNRPLSMVDCLIRLMLDDRSIRIKYLATFNLRDYVDVCKTNHIQII